MRTLPARFPIAVVAWSLGAPAQIPAEFFDYRLNNLAAHFQDTHIGALIAWGTPWVN